jgi:hypothetical protein
LPGQTLVFAYLAESAIAINLAYLALESTRYYSVIEKRITEELEKSEQKLKVAGDRELVGGEHSKLGLTYRFRNYVRALAKADTTKLSEFDKDGKYENACKVFKKRRLFRPRQFFRAFETSFAHVICMVFLVFSVLYLMRASYVDAGLSFSGIEPWDWLRAVVQTLFSPYLVWLITSVGIIVPGGMIIFGRRFAVGCVEEHLSVMNSQLQGDLEKLEREKVTQKIDDASAAIGDFRRDQAENLQSSPGSVVVG